MGYITKADRMLIGGELVASSSGVWDESINPVDETIVGRVPAGTKEDVLKG
jgi:aldehyde dehydrogenase (NAD+)/betaine-aldehyde dehydrogenase